MQRRLSLVGGPTGLIDAQQDGEEDVSQTADGGCTKGQERCVKTFKSAGILRELRHLKTENMKTVVAEKLQENVFQSQSSDRLCEG